jgi:formate hydrogenlyase transcriptional activator
MPNTTNSINLAGDILIVDDEIANLQLLTQVLSDAGYQALRSIKRPQSAIESALAQPPSLILLDVRMPEMDGFEVCRRLKQEERTRDIPVIFVSALQDVQDRLQGFKAGGVDFISKPFQEPEVLARVRTHLALHNMQLHLEDLVAKRTAKLVETNTAFEEAQQLSRTGNWSWVVETDTVTWSKTLYAIAGLDPEKPPPTYQETPSLYTAESWERLRPSVARALKDGEPYELELDMVRPDGHVRHTSTLGRAVKSADGRVVRLLGTVQDVTDLTRANRELKQAYDEIRQLKDRLEAENLTLREEVKVSFEDNELIGKSHEFRTVLQQAEHVAPTDSTVLILGETGTGKGLIARKIHLLSGRKDRPLVHVNCAALPATLIESEFFGHEKGAFTGAMDRKIGRFELADGGTIFLDEIGDLPIELQAKLLRVLQDHEFERLGSSTTRTVDTRIIAATNRELDTLIEQGTFRTDLYYRLGVFPIRMPPLRERRSDIPILVWFFITMLQSRLGKTIESVPSRVMDALTAYDWPGNVRELSNIVERAMILSPGAKLELGTDFPWGQSARRAASRTRGRKSAKLEEVERAHIVSVLEECDWKVRGKDGAAERLGLKRTTLQSRMKKLGIQRPTS